MFACDRFPSLLTDKHSFLQMPDEENKLLPAVYVDFDG